MSRAMDVDSSADMCQPMKFLDLNTLQHNGLGGSLWVCKLLL